MNYKKGTGEMMWTTAVLTAILLFFVLYSTTWAGIFRKQASSLNEPLQEKTGLVEDYEEDGVVNINDKCPCIKGSSDNNGCPDGYQITNTAQGNEERTCLTKKKT